MISCENVIIIMKWDDYWIVMLSYDHCWQLKCQIVKFITHCQPTITVSFVFHFLRIMIYTSMFNGWCTIFYIYSLRLNPDQMFKLPSTISVMVNPQRHPIATQMIYSLFNVHYEPCVTFVWHLLDYFMSRVLGTQSFSIDHIVFQGN